MTTKNWAATAPAALMLSLVFSACGGGGGGGNDGSNAGTANANPNTSNGTNTTVAAITKANYSEVASIAVDPVGELLNLDQVTGSLTSGVEIRGTRFGLGDATLAIYSRFRGRNGQLITGAAYTENCSGGGSITINESSASDQSVTVGDSASITAINCKESGLPTFNGKLSLKVTAVSGDPVNSTRYSMTLAGLYDNFTFITGNESVSINGDIAISASQNGSDTVNIGIRGNALGFSVVQSGVTTGSYRLSDYSFSGTDANGAVSLSGKYGVSGTSPKLGGQYAFAVETLQPIVVGSSSDHPSSGVLIVRGAPASVTVTAINSSSVRLDYSDNGDGTVSATRTLAWTEFDTLN
ncbi:hypothetical protein KTQ42_21825 [Noviherbaspirillum sp. L7-7A]|uniref:hypothetical protein n=1 Tax=Noviherbaspirillum sp. L7-7A TaxID=2850560 RepID=UPI001C2C8406|nr:hypothetical protein [Noviherbaspirillum sp. L7-7A]MBV0881919.1 hypothetical protein [Noviherbaspirillum sp. L7-7A]